MKNPIPKCLLLLILILNIGCNADKKNDVQETIDSDKKALIFLKEVEWPKAYAEQDTILLDRILGDDFKMIDQYGNWYTKKDELEWNMESSIISCFRC